MTQANIESLGTARLDLVVDLDQFDTAINAARTTTSNMSQAAQADYQRLNAAERRRVETLLRQADTVGFTRQQQILYNAALRAVPTSILDELRTKLAATGTAAVGATKQLNQYGISAAQQAAALRGVPAQLTDIVVSLQGGQQPLTVLLQQGGQLKDMFGGIVPAAKALGGAVAALITPYTILAGAVAGLATAYVLGSREADQYRDALILTGNAAGITSNALSTMASRMSDTQGTTGKAAEVLTKLVSTGRLAATSIEQLGDAAIAWEKATSKSVDDTIAEYERIASAPAEAIAKLNERYHFLTAAVYEQIRALEEEGRTQDAARLALSTYAEAMQTRSAEIIANVGYIEAAWNGVKGAAKGAWDMMLGLGRELTPQQKLAEVNKELAQLGDSYFHKDRINFLKAQRTGLEDLIKWQDAAARSQSALSAEVERSIQGQKDMQGYMDSRKGTSLSRALEEEGKAFKRATASFKEDSKEYLDALKVHNDKVEQLKKQFAPKGSVKDDAATRLLAEYAQSEAAIRGQLVSQEKLGTWAKRRLELEQQLADLKEKKVLTADQKSILAHEAQLRAGLKNVEAAERELRVAQEITKVEAMRASLSSARELEQRQYDDQVAALGLGDREQEQLRARQSIVRDYQRQMAQATRDLTTGSKAQETYDAETALLKEHLQKRLDAQADYYAKVNEARADWHSGASSALQNYLNQASDVAGQTKTLFGNAFQGMEDAVVRFATTGKLSFKEFANQVISDLARIAARQAIVGMVGSLVGALSSGITASASATVGGTMTGSVDGLTPIGGGASSGASWGAGSAVMGARASGGPTGPNSLYRVNELGPEIYEENGRQYLMTGAKGGFVTPMTQNATGGGTSSAIGSLSIQIVVQSDGTTTASGDTSNANATALADSIVSLVKTEIVTSWRPGNISYAKARELSGR